MRESIIADTSSLIALEKIDLLPLLCKMYGEVVVTESVANEFGNLFLPCISLKRVESNLITLLTIDLNLGKGEADVIALATQTGRKVIIDDSKARKVAENIGVEVTGTIGILMKAEQVGLIPNAYEKAKELREKGFYVSDALLRDISRFGKTA